VEQKTGFEEIAQTEKTLAQTFRVLRENLDKAEADFLHRRTEIITAFESEQKREAEGLSNIGNALDSILSKAQVQVQRQV